ncbi:hypothetical protein KIPB_009899 [Kipferlia bialata]|uniref:Uncharacterized protein n=1 Tax=Kipferlia bialata TaxID=797122 RepID=A0A9K3D2H0_9EUKA|nr:hypothetical protein KIPB_009899 [Kipferlia bialata]|eukprot:g9899.t1
MPRSSSPYTPAGRRAPSPMRSRTPSRERDWAGAGTGPAKRTAGPRVKKLAAEVKRLQSENEQQLQIEYESQKAFEVLSNQVKGLRSAFSTLTDVLVDEFDTLRSQIGAKLHDYQASFETLSATVAEQQKELEGLGERERGHAEGLQTTAVAVDTLGDRLTATQSLVTAQAEEVAGSLREVANLKDMVTATNAGMSRVEEAGRQIGEDTHRQLTALNDNYSAQTETLRDALNDLRQQVRSQAKRREEGDRVLAQDIKGLARAQTHLGKSLQESRQETGRVLKEQELETARRLDSVTTAITTLADMLNGRPSAMSAMGGYGQGSFS